MSNNKLSDNNWDTYGIFSQNSPIDYKKYKIKILIGKRIKYQLQTRYYNQALKFSFSGKEDDIKDDNPYGKADYLLIEGKFFPTRQKFKDFYVRSTKRVKDVYVPKIVPLEEPEYCSQKVENYEIWIPLLHRTKYVFRASIYNHLKKTNCYTGTKSDIKFYKINDKKGVIISGKWFKNYQGLYFFVKYLSKCCGGYDPKIKQLKPDNNELKRSDNGYQLSRSKDFQKPLAQQYPQFWQEFCKPMLWEDVQEFTKPFDYGQLESLDIKNYQKNNKFTLFNSNNNAQKNSVDAIDFVDDDSATNGAK